MRQILIQQNGWAPARFAAPAGIGDPQPTPLVPPEPPKKPFIDSAALGAVVAASGAVAAGTIAYVYTKSNSKWSSFFWVLSGLIGFIAIDDLSRLRR